MTQVWDENNRLVPVTVVKAGPVRRHPGPHRGRRTATPPSSSAFGAIDPRKVNKPQAGHFAKAGVTPRRHLVEIRTADAGDYTLGQEVTAELFEAGAGRRRHRHHQGQGLRRRHEASRLPRRRRLARCAPQPPQARLDRRLRHPRPRVQGHEDGRPHGRRPRRPPRTSRSTPWTPRTACCSSRAPSPAPRAASSSSAPPRRGPDAMAEHR